LFCNNAREARAAARGEIIPLGPCKPLDDGLSPASRLFAGKDLNLPLLQISKKAGEIRDD
jgi:hypothetical protein